MTDCAPEVIPAPCSLAQTTSYPALQEGKLSPRPTHMLWGDSFMSFCVWPGDPQGGSLRCTHVS